MVRLSIFAKINAERHYQNEKWGTEFDEHNTPNDWAAYIAKYLGQAVTMPYDDTAFRRNMIKVAALATAALEQDSYAPRHYDAEARLLQA